MPGLCLGNAVFNDDCDALATHARNRLQSDPDARCQDSRRHFPFVATAAVSTRLPLFAWSGRPANMAALGVEQQSVATDARLLPRRGRGRGQRGADDRVVANAIVRGVEPGLRKRSCGARQPDPRDWAIPNPGRSCFDASICGDAGA